jgi:arabinofuranan 3-O-arabinosyltransferase
VLNSTGLQRRLVRRIEQVPWFSAALWATGVLSLVYLLFAVTEKNESHDFTPAWLAVRAVLNHQSPYNIFLPWPPSSIPFLFPFGLIDLRFARVAFEVVQAGAILASGALLLKLFGARWRSPIGAALLLGLTLYGPVITNLHLGNVNGVILLGEAAALVFASRGAWSLMGVALGVTLAIKPVLLPLVLIPVLWRRWTAVVIALGTPLALSGVALLFVVRGSDFFTHWIPFLLNGTAEGLQEFNVSLSGAATALHLPAAVLSAMKLAVAVGTLTFLWLRSHANDDLRLRLVDTSCVILLGTFLDFSFSWTGYGIFLLPLLVSVVHPESLARSWVIWAGAFCVGGPDVFIWRHFGHVASTLAYIRPTAGFLLLLLGLGTGLFSRRDEPARTRSIPSVLSPTAI